MIEVGGASGFANVNLSAGMGLNLINGLPMSSAASAVSGPTAAAIAPAAMSINLQTLVQMLQQFSLAEILLALLLASTPRRCDRDHDHTAGTDSLAAFALASALLQQGSFHSPQSPATFVSSVNVPSGTTLNVAG
jgi:hypothetical protein